MIAVEDLTGIEEYKRNSIIKCLDDLLVSRDRKEYPIISGYNLYKEVIVSDRVITFSNIHETEDYKQDMLKDLISLGYSSEYILRHMRNKAGSFLWKSSYITTDNEGKPLKIKIKNVINGKYLDLVKYSLPFKNYLELKDSEGKLVAESEGWELNIEFNDLTKLINVVDLFVLKSSKILYNEKGEEIGENVNHWRDAYYTPVLIVGEKAVNIASDMPHFDIATRIGLVEGGNEISFIIHNKLNKLRELPHYNKLKEFGFIESKCLANKPFLMDVDMIR